MPYTECANCNKEIFKWPYMIKRSSRHFCGNVCKGVWMTENCAGSNGYNWKGGIWNNKVQVLCHQKYRTWRSKQLENKVCIFCNSQNKLELHHIVYRSKGGELMDENNVTPICSKCHDIFHSNRSKGDELRGSLKRRLQGNPQPSPVNSVSVAGKVQRLMGEELTNKPDTSVAPERDDIVRAI